MSGIATKIGNEIIRGCFASLGSVLQEYGSAKTALATAALFSAIANRVYRSPTSVFAQRRMAFIPRFGEQCINVGELCVSLFQRIAEWIVHARTPIQPGHFGNASTWNKEVISRIAFCSLSALLLIPSLGGVLMGIVLSKIGDLMMGQRFMHWIGKENQSCAYPKEKYTVFSGNVCMLWGPLPMCFGGVSPAHVRVKEVADKIRSRDPDFVFLQEVSFGAAELLYQELIKDFKHFYVRVGPKPSLMLDTGLFIATKRPGLPDVEFTQFPSGAMPRGLFCIDALNCWILTTHLEAGSEGESGEMRKIQLGIIAEKIQELKRKKDVPCFLFGDLNIKRTNELENEYFTAKIPENFFDAFASDHPDVNRSNFSCTDEITAARWGLPKPDVDGYLIDYALLDKEAKDKNAVVKITTGLIGTYDFKKLDQALSDHRFLATAITMQPAPRPCTIIQTIN